MVKRGFERLNAYASAHPRKRVLIEILQFLEMKGKRFGDPICSTLEESLKNASRSNIALSGEILFYPMVYNGLNQPAGHYSLGFIEEEKRWGVAVYYFLKGITTKSGDILYYDPVVAQLYNQVQYNFPRKKEAKKRTRRWTLGKR